MTRCAPPDCRRGDDRKRLNSHKRVSKRDGRENGVPFAAPRSFGCPSSSQAIAIVSQFSTLPGVQETAAALSEPSTLLLVGISLGGIALGKILTLGYRAQD